MRWPDQEDLYNYCTLYTMIADDFTTKQNVFMVIFKEGFVALLGGRVRR